MYTISHVAISVKNIEVTKLFYKQFGFEVIKDWKASDLSVQISHLKLDKMVIEVFCYKDYVNIPEESKVLSTDLPIIGVKHFALGVPNISLAYNDLLAKNIISSNTQITTGRLGKQYFFISDPDGILVEVIES